MAISEKYFKEKFEGKSFTIEEVSKSLDISISTVYSIIRRLLLSKEIVKIAPKTYKFYEVKEIEPSKEIGNLRKFLLENETREFKFTGLCVLESFLHHVPFVLIYHLFVEKGSSEDIIKKLEEYNKEIVIVPELSSNELNMIVNKTNTKKILIVKERSYFKYSKKGLASPESAFVDIFFEITRGKIPYLETDLNEILKIMIHNNLINFSMLINYAHDRKIDNEIIDILKEISKEIEMSKEVLKWISKNT